MTPTVTILRGEIYIVARWRKRVVLKQLEPRNPVWFDLRLRKRD